MRLRTLFIAVAFALVSIVPAAAFAYREGTGTRNVDCAGCHGLVSGSLAETGTVTGPHMGYTTTSRKCQSCHQVHAAPAAKLLPAATIIDTCNACHDGTGGNGVYGTLTRRSITPTGQHRIGVTNTVPGGNATTGLDATMTFSTKPDNFLTCTDCHTPHGQSVVASFTGDRWRTTTDNQRPIVSTRLLKKRPGGISYDVTEYGSGWCLACHKGRGVMPVGPTNHPVATDTVASYDHLTRVAASGTATEAGSLGGLNRGYLMLATTVADLGTRGSGPICQQCHEDARNVGTINSDGTVATPAAFSITTTDGATVGNNPRFQNFPHETANLHLLVETDDNLCLNCHPLAPLP